jgi:hypothetical protein
MKGRNSHPSNPAEGQAAAGGNRTGAVIVIGIERIILYLFSKTKAEITTISPAGKSGLC